MGSILTRCSGRSQLAVRLRAAHGQHSPYSHSRPQQAPTRAAWAVSTPQPRGAERPRGVAEDGARVLRPPQTD
eukprot:7615064-Pyramimonas_sp.AAC.1